MVALQHICAVNSELQRLESLIKRICDFGEPVAKRWSRIKVRHFQEDYSVKLIEHNQQRATELAELSMIPRLAVMHLIKSHCRRAY